MPHPIVLAVVVLDSLSVLLILAAGLDALAVVLSWAPASPTARQVRLERRAESAALRARVATFLFLASTLAFVLAVASVLPGIVPGAMCGTGVLQAMGGDGPQAFALRMASVGVLGAWHLLDRLDRTRPEAPLITVSGRAILLAIPLVTMAVWRTLDALRGLEGQGPVDCCSVVYDGVRNAGTSAGPDGTWLLPAVLVGAAILVALGGAMAAVPRVARRPFTAQVERDGLWIRVAHNGRRIEAMVLTARAAELQRLMPFKAPPDMSRFLLSPMPGLLVDIAVKPGQAVQAGERLAVIEAMKMENILTAAQDGTVAELMAARGESLAVDQPILKFA